MAAEIQFEKALERLEKIVEDLETGDVTLEEALKKYEEGVKLSRSCQEKLVQAEKKIELLTKNKDGSFKKENFSVDEESSTRTNNAKKKGKSSSKQSALNRGDDENLLI